MKVTYKLSEQFLHVISNKVNSANSEYKITVTQRHSGNFIKKLFNVKNTYIELSNNSDKVSINYDKALKQIEKILKPHISDEWKSQESEVYIPSLINKELDNVAAKYGKNIDSTQKEKIRSNVLNKAHLMHQFKGVKNLNAAAQTSIGQTTSTHLLKNKSLQNFVRMQNMSRDIQSEVTATIANKIADKLYEDIMDTSIHNLRRVTQEEAKKELYQPKKMDLNMSKINSSDITLD